MIDNFCRTIWKWIPFDIYYRLGDGDGLQGFATTKCTVTNAGHGIGDGDGLQGRTRVIEKVSSKRTITNTPCSLPNRIIL